MIAQKERPINIKDLVIEEPPKEDYGFKIEDFVTEEDWQILKKQFFIMRNEEVPNWIARSVHLASNMVILFPEKRSEINFDDKFKKAVLEKAVEGLGGKDDIFLDYLESAVILFGKDEQLKQLKIEAYKASKKALKRSRAFAANLGPARNFKTIYPNENIEAIPKNFSISSLKREIDENWLDNAVHLASDIKIAYPKVFAQLKIGRNLFDDEKERFEKMHEGRLKVGRRRRKQTLNIVDLVSTAADLKILAAKEIRFTDCGFDLIMKDEGLDEFIPNLPEVKRYGN